MNHTRSQLDRMRSTWVRRGVGTVSAEGMHMHASRTFQKFHTDNYSQKFKYQVLEHPPATGNLRIQNSLIDNFNQQ